MILFRSPGRVRAAARTVAAALALSACSSTSDTASETVGSTAASSAAATEIVVTHAQGETTVPVNPQKVVTFDMASLDTLDALGVP